MSTRSTIRFMKENEDPVATVYKHYDGYIDGFGYELAEWLSGMTLINGMMTDKHYGEKYANGVGCLAAKFIKKFKKETGDIYLCAPDPDYKEDYNYKVIVKPYGLEKSANDCVTIEVDCFGTPIFKGSPKELMEFEESYD